MQNKSARECALSMLERSDRTEQEIRRKLREKGYAPEEISETVVFLKEYRYVNDGEYAKRYIRTCSSRKSERRIRMELEKRGISRELIEDGLAEEPVDEECQIRAFLEKKGVVPNRKLEPDEYRRITGALARRGFSYDAIRRATDRMCEEEY